MSIHHRWLTSTDLADMIGIVLAQEEFHRRRLVFGAVYVAQRVWAPFMSDDGRLFLGRAETATRNLWKKLWPIDVDGWCWHVVDHCVESFISDAYHRRYLTCQDHVRDLQSVADIPELPQAVEVFRDVIGPIHRKIGGGSMPLMDGTGRPALVHDWSWYGSSGLLSPKWLQQDGGRSAKLAHALEHANAWTELYSLADALEEAGCPEQDLIMHCRNRVRCPDCDGTGRCEGLGRMLPAGGFDCACKTCDGTGWPDMTGSHGPGCWAIDAVYGPVRHEK